jgi:iron complex transport system substrate-binding protein
LGIICSIAQGAPPWAGAVAARGARQSGGPLECLFSSQVGGHYSVVSTRPQEAAVRRVLPPDRAAWPTRIVCLTEEPTEVLYAIGAADAVVGVSGYTVRPPQARRKPKVSSFLDANFDRIMALEPDLVLGFSDLQADLAAELIRRGVGVHIFNQRSVVEILQAIRQIAALVGRSAAGDALAGRCEDHLEALAREAERLPRRVSVFFEEWPDPLISGIRWTSELLELVGADDVCGETRGGQAAKERIVDAALVAERNPELIIASWCGKKARQQTIVERWPSVRAVIDDQLYEVKSAFILQPGPAALTEGVRQLAAIVSACARGEHLPRSRPEDLRRADLEGELWTGGDEGHA